MNPPTFIKMEMQSDKDFIRFQDERTFIVENNYGENNGDNGLSTPFELGMT